MIETVDPRPFDPCEDIPLDVIQRIGLAFTPPIARGRPALPLRRGQLSDGGRAVRLAHLRGRRCRPTPSRLDIDGHRAAQYWVMKPTDWNNRWWITCVIAFKTSYGVIQQSLFYSPIYAADDVDCLQTNLQRGRELSNYYKY